MFTYYVRLSLLSLRRNPVLTALTIGAIAIGIGVSMTTLTVYHAMSANPMGAAGDTVFAVRLDTWDPDSPFRSKYPDEAPWELTWRDANALLASDIPLHQAAMYKTSGVIQAESDDVPPEVQLIRATGGDFFELFDTPFLFGSGWDSKADQDGAQVIVLGKETNEKMFGGENSVGRQVRLFGKYFQVVGVLDHWLPMPKFYDVNNGAFNDPEDSYIPFNLTLPLQLDSAGNTNCWKDEKLDSYDAFMASECVWIQYWVELENREQEDAYQAFLDNYAREQKSLGRMERPLKTQLDNVGDWLDVRRVVRNDNKVLLGLSFMFLLVCLFNAVGLVLAKFVGRAPQVGLRRALGASTAAIFQQHLVETSLVGLAGGILGLGLAQLGLLGVRSLADAYDKLTNFDFTLVGIALATALASGILAGLYPTWRICSTAPAGYLKTQ